MKLATFLDGFEIPINSSDFDLSWNASNSVGIGRKVNPLKCFIMIMCQSNWQALFSQNLLYNDDGQRVLICSLKRTTSKSRLRQRKTRSKLRPWLHWFAWQMLWVCTILPPTPEHPTGCHCLVAEETGEWSSMATDSHPVEETGEWSSMATDSQPNVYTHSTKTWFLHWIVNVLEVGGNQTIVTHSIPPTCLYAIWYVATASFTTNLMSLPWTIWRLRSPEAYSCRNAKTKSVVPQSEAGNVDLQVVVRALHTCSTDSGHHRALRWRGFHQGRSWVRRRPIHSWSTLHSKCKESSLASPSITDSELGHQACRGPSIWNS